MGSIPWVKRCKKYFTKEEAAEARRRQASDSYQRNKEQVRIRVCARRRELAAQRRGSNVIEFYRLGRHTERVVIPAEVSQERQQVFNASLTPDQILMGDPMPGRSALDKKRAAATLVFGSFFK